MLSAMVYQLIIHLGLLDVLSTSNCTNTAKVLQLKRHTSWSSGILEEVLATATHDLFSTPLLMVLSFRLLVIL